MDTRHGASPTTTAASAAIANKPLVFSKMESLVREMQSPDSGIPIGDQKIFLTSIPSVFMGYDIVEWLMERLEVADSESIHLANLLCQYGYFFPVGETRSLIVKDDSSLYRFQTPYYWPSQTHNADTTDYAIYLSKRLSRNKQKHGLEDYEMEAYNKLKKGLQHKWDFVLMQAEEQVRLAKDRKKGDKIVTDSQERAYWRVYRPPPGYTNCLENAPIPDRNNMANRVKKKTIDICKQEIGLIEKQIERTRIKVSVAGEGLITNFNTYFDYDYYLTAPQPSNPWLTDDITFWDLNETLVDVLTEKRVKRWAISFADLVADPTGINEFTTYLRKEYSHENIRFWQAVNDLKYGLSSEVNDKVKKVYAEFLKPGAPCEINIDGKTMEVTQQNMKTPSRYTYDLAAEHVYILLLKKDCYPRFLRSEHYKNLLANAIQPKQKTRFFSFGGPGKKKATAMASSNSVSLQAQTPQPLKRHGSDEQTASQGNASGPEPHLGIGAALGVFQPRVDCDPPYSAKEPSSGGVEGVGSEVCPWDTSEPATDNICPWETAPSPPQPPIMDVAIIRPPAPHLQASHSTRPHHQSVIQKTPLQLAKPRPDRCKSVDVNTQGSQRPQSASFSPSLVPIRGSSPSDGSPVRGEKAKSVDACTWESQPASKKVSSTLTSPKETTSTTLAPIGPPYMVTERRASEGVLRMALGVPWEEVVSVPKSKDKNESSDSSEKPKGKSGKERSSIRIKVLPTGEEESTRPTREKSKSSSPSSKKGTSADLSIRSGHVSSKMSSELKSPTSSEHLNSPTSPKPSEKSVRKGSVKKQHPCTEMVPYTEIHKPGTSSSKRAVETKSSEVIPASPGKQPNVVAPWEDSPPQKETADVCPWEDDSLTPTWL